MYKINVDFPELLPFSMSSLTCIRERLEEASRLIFELQQTVERLIAEEQESIVTPLVLNFDLEEQPINTPSVDHSARASWSETDTNSFRRLLLEGRSYSEIAQLLGKTTQQVRDKKKTETRGRRI